MNVKYGNKVVGHIVTNRSMTIDEALELIGIDINELDGSGNDPIWDRDLFVMDYDEQPGTISIHNNPDDPCSPQDAINKIGWDVIVNAMDDDVREHVHMDKAPCSELEFLVAYLATGNSIAIG